MGGVSTARTTTYPPEDLPIVFVEACEREQRGILVTIDEIQKVALEEVSAICNAFQLASRKGHDIMLAVAGLPYAHEDIIRYPGCTYMRRAVHEELGLLGRMEVEDALLEAIKLTGGVELDDRCLVMLVQASLGHPYLIQLLGYHLVDRLNELGVQGPHTVTASTTREQSKRAYTKRAKRAPISSDSSRPEQNESRHRLVIRRLVSEANNPTLSARSAHSSLGIQSPETKVAPPALLHGES